MISISLCLVKVQSIVVLPSVVGYLGTYLRSNLFEAIQIDKIPCYTYRFGYSRGKGARANIHGTHRPRQIMGVLEVISLARHRTLGYLCVAHILLYVWSMFAWSNDMHDLCFRLALAWAEVGMLNFSHFWAFTLYLYMEILFKIHFLLFKYINIDKVYI